MKLYVGVAAFALLLGACAVPGASLPPSPRPTLIATTAPTPRGPDFPEETPPTVTDVPATLLDAMLAEASDLSSLPVSELSIERAEAVTWPDGSLGCPEPGMMYTQALVDGYWVVIRAGDETYDFRASAIEFRRCEQVLPTPDIPPPGYVY